MDAAGEPVIAAVSTLGDFAQTSGVVVAALLGATALLARSDRARSVAMLCALVLTPVLLVASIWSTPQIEPLRDRPLLALGAACAGLVLLALGAVAIHRKPELVALAAAAALPFRVPIESGGDTANLLVPLYLVIAAGVLAYAVPRLRATPGLDDDDSRYKPGLLEWLLAGAVVLYAAQAAYSSDFDRALSQVIFFYVPFALLFALLVRIDWTPRLAGRCLVVLLVLAVAFVAIGFVEYARRELLLNPKVISSNQFESYFRVNSLFFDPNIYGRFLVTVMLGLTAVLLWVRRTALVAGCACALVLLWAGLVLTLSQSSFTALLAGLAVLGALRWGVRRAALVVAAFAVAGAVVVLAAPGAVGVDQSTDAVTSGRSTLVSGRARPGARPAGRGLGRGVLPARVPPPREDVERAGVGRVAHDPDHRGGRAGAGRARAVPRAARRGDRRVAARRAGVDRPRGDRSGVRRPRRAHAALRGVPRGPAGVGAAGGRRSARPRRGSDRGRASAPPRRSAGRG